MGKYQQGTFCREHSHAGTRQFSDVMAPDSSSIDSDLGPVLGDRTRLFVKDLDAHHRVSLFHNRGHFGPCQDLGPMQFGIDDIRRAQPERIHASVRDLYGAG